MAQKFFFYGTLLQGMPNPVASAIHKKLEAGVPASVRGRLYAIEEAGTCYPALVPAADGYAVHGMVYKAGPDFTAADLALLDRYEAFDPADPASSEYQRETVPVMLATGAVLAAGVYLYTAPVPPAAREIVGGSFKAFLSENELRPFARDF